MVIYITRDEKCKSPDFVWSIITRKHDFLLAKIVQRLVNEKNNFWPDLHVCKKTVLVQNLNISFSMGIMSLGCWNRAYFSTNFLGKFQQENLPKKCPYRPKSRHFCTHYTLYLLSYISVSIRRFLSHQFRFVLQNIANKNMFGFNFTFQGARILFFLW